MIRARVQSQRLWKSCEPVMFATVGRGVCNASGGPFMCVRCTQWQIGQQWVTVKSPPTRGGNWYQGRMESSKRSVVSLSQAGHLWALQLMPVHMVQPANYQVADFVSDARFAGNAKNNFRIKKTKVGQLLEENPVIRIGQRKIRRRRAAGVTSVYQTGNISNDSKFEHGEIDIHSPEGALQESLPTDDELAEILPATHGHLVARSQRAQTSEQVDNSASLNEFDKQYFLDVPSLQNERASSGATVNKVIDVDDRNEFDQQYFGSLHDVDRGSSSTSEEQEGAEQKRPLSSKANQKSSQPVYMDSSLAEDHSDNLFYARKTQKALEDFDKQLGRMFEDAGQDKHIDIKSLFEFEPYEKPTEFQRADDFTEHRELTFTNEPMLEGQVTVKMQTKAVKAKLEADRIFSEKKEELTIDGYDLSDLEPEIIGAMKAIKRARAVRSGKVKAPKGQKVFGSPDPSLPATDVSCSGCGAQFQAHDPKHPGFLPGEKYRELLEAGGLERAMCQRCWYLTHHQMALDVSITEDDYRDIITSIRRTRALVVVLVDLLDFPCSLIPNLKAMVGERRPMVIVGNKADLLPKDSPDWSQRITKQLLKACVEAGVCNEESVQHVCIVSAKSGFGIEDLITALQKKWGTNNDVYLLGTANVGKSTLFNRLLKSDYCKAKATYLIGKATISRWPGTTLNLLRFPIVKPTAEKMALRNDRLVEEKRQAKAELENQKTKGGLHKKRLDELAYVRGEWNQILTKLTVDELKLVIPKTIILPRTISLKPGNTFLLGGLGRLDYLEGRMAAFFTVFASKDLPMRIIPTAGADEVHQGLADRNHLTVPLGGPERMKTFPAMQPVEMKVVGQGWHCSAADVLFSSTGWVAVTTAKGEEVHLRAFTPGGHGCLLRQPALLPYVVNLRGDRTAKKSPYFKLDRHKLTRFL
ncbi:nitric oxide-associated protein 1-like [Acanthaster planci]|uniref:Nitric oxide-associated protein 1-like n=1 Tax=Acanthaster planci TaxID=133434 RepID=A0A8B7YNX1_ACAPL|nr:nitric oxide-associated protein 1-like [Acanthaster planci]